MSKWWSQFEIKTEICLLMKVFSKKHNCRGYFYNTCSPSSFSRHLFAQFDEIKFPTAEAQSLALFFICIEIFENFTQTDTWLGDIISFNNLSVKLLLLLLLWNTHAGNHFSIFNLTGKPRVFRKSIKYA